MDNFNQIITGLHATLRDVLVLLDRHAQGVVFICDDAGKLVGVLTDGDVRRALIQGASLDDWVAGYLNSNFVAGSTTVDESENIRLLSNKIRCLPVLDPAGRPVRMLRWADLFRLPIMEPTLKGNEFAYVTDCLATNWISSQGGYVDRFQQCFADYHQTSHALCVANGTVALHLALAALGVGPGDEVIIPDLTFVSPASMTLLCGATPVFADVDRHTWTVLPEEIEKRVSPRTRAIIPVHLFGHPCDMEPILAIARRHNLFVIEDCAEALGAEYEGQRVGTFGHVGTFSFFANKVITTGEGGMVITRDPELHRKMQLLRDHGMTREKRYWHQVAGFNYRLTNIQAAIGLAQMERIDAILAYRETVVERYSLQLTSVPGIALPAWPANGRNIHWLYSITIDETRSGIDRNHLMAQLASYGIDTRPFFYPLHCQPPFPDEAGHSFPNAEWLAEHGISLPTSNDIRLEDVDRVCAAIRSIIEDSAAIYEHGFINQKLNTGAP